MPIHDYHVARTWNALYRRHIAEGSEPVRSHPLFGQWATYGRTYANLMGLPKGDISFHRNYWSALTATVPIPTNASVAIIGGGFGFLCEAALDAGWTGAQLVDDSNWIDANKGVAGWRYDGQNWVDDTPNMAAAVQAVYHKASLDNPNNLRNLLGGRQDVVITEFMLSSLYSTADSLYDASTENDELSETFNNCETLATPTGTVIHLVTAVPNAKPPLHVKTLAEWKALRPAHRFAPAYVGGDWEVL